MMSCNGNQRHEMLSVANRRNAIILCRSVKIQIEYDQVLFKYRRRAPIWYLHWVFYAS